MPAERAGASAWVCLGAVATAHGVRGELKLKCFTERPEDVAAYGPVYDRHGARLFALEVLRVVPGGVIARADGVRDRSAAERLRGTALYVPRDALPAADEDEFYHDDLIGLDARDGHGTPLGVVRAVFDFGAGDLLEIVTPGGKFLHVPFTKAAVPAIDLADGVVTVEPPAELIARPEHDEDGATDEVGP